MNGQVLLPRDHPARVRRERRAGGKRITIISGLDAHATDLPAVLKRFKAQFGAGGTITARCVELQGDHRERVAEILQQMGYPAKPTGFAF